MLSIHDLLQKVSDQQDNPTSSQITSLRVGQCLTVTYFNYLRHDRQNTVGGGELCTWAPSVSKVLRQYRNSLFTEGIDESPFLPLGQVNKPWGSGVSTSLMNEIKNSWDRLLGQYLLQLLFVKEAGLVWEKKKIERYKTIWSGIFMNSLNSISRASPAEQSYSQLMTVRLEVSSFFQPKLKTYFFCAAFCDLT